MNFCANKSKMSDEMVSIFLSYIYGLYAFIRIGQ